jgi:hypothetical protein
MIQFPCRCGNLFRLDDEEAGTSLQCPKCGLLNDVPLLGELASLAEDGTYKLDDAPPAPKPRLEVADLVQGLGIDPNDYKASEIDLRLTPQQVAAIGAPSPTTAPPPRYDPETGELIREMNFRDSAGGKGKTSPKDIPFAKPAITYGHSRTAFSDSWRGSIRALCEPINIVVMTIAIAAQLFTFIGIMYSIRMGFFIMTGFLFLFQLLLIAHFGNVVDETGVEEREDLPRLLRDLRFYEDIWSPLVAMLGSIFVCYAPALVCLLAASMERSAFFTLTDFLLGLGWLIGFCVVTMSVIEEGLSKIDWIDHFVRPLMTVLIGSIACLLPAGLCVAVHASDTVTEFVALVLAAAGTIFLPGALLTLATSGAVANIHPGRLIKTISICGSRYLSPLIAWILGLLLFGFGLGIESIDIFGASAGPLFGAKVRLWMIAYPLMVSGLILLHLCCFEIGMLYRRHHDAFPWLLQRHHPVHHTRRSVAIRAASRAARPKLAKK